MITLTVSSSWTMIMLGSGDVMLPALWYQGVAGQTTARSWENSAQPVTLFSAFRCVNYCIHGLRACVSNADNVWPGLSYNA